MTSVVDHLAIHSIGLAALGAVAFALGRLWRRDPISSYGFHRCLLYAVLALPLLQLGLAGRIGADVWSPLRSWWNERTADRSAAQPVPTLVPPAPLVERTVAPVELEGPAAPWSAADDVDPWVVVLNAFETARIAEVGAEIGAEIDAAPIAATTRPADPQAEGAPKPASAGHTWLALYGLGTLAVLVWHLLRLGATARTLGRCEPVDDPRVLAAWKRVAGDSRLYRRVRLLTGDHLSSPGCWGLVRPIVVVPRRAAQPDRERALDCALMHELVHLERGDARVALVAAIARALFWFHPVVWWITAELERLRESSCDLTVVRRTGRPKSYALALLSYAFERENDDDDRTNTGWSAVRSACPTFMHWTHSPSQLRRRIEMLANQRTGPSRCKRVVTFGLAAAALSSLWGGQLAAAAAIFPKGDEPSKQELAERLTELQTRTDELMAELDALLASVEDLVDGDEFAFDSVDFSFDVPDVDTKFDVLFDGDLEFAEIDFGDIDFAELDFDEVDFAELDFGEIDFAEFDASDFGELDFGDFDVVDVTEHGDGRFEIRVKDCDGEAGECTLQIETNGRIVVRDGDDELSTHSFSFEYDDDESPQVIVIQGESDDDSKQRRIRVIGAGQGIVVGDGDDDEAGGSAYFVVPDHDARVQVWGSGANGLKYSLPRVETNGVFHWNDETGDGIYEYHFADGDDDEDDDDAPHVWRIPGGLRNGQKVFSAPRVEWSFGSNDDDEADEHDEDDDDAVWLLPSPHGQNGSMSFSLEPGRYVIPGIPGGVGQGGTWITVPDSDGDEPARSWVTVPGGQALFSSGNGAWVTAPEGASWFSQGGNSWSSNSQKRRLGVSVDSPGAALAGHLGIDADDTLIITEVEKSSLAADAGLRVHDVIVSIGGRDGATYDDLRAAIDAAGDKPMKIVILRKGDKKKITIEFEDDAPKAKKLRRNSVQFVAPDGQLTLPKGLTLDLSKAQSLKNLAKSGITLGTKDWKKLQKDATRLQRDAQRLFDKGKHEKLQRRIQNYLNHQKELKRLKIPYSLPILDGTDRKLRRVLPLFERTAVEPEESECAPEPADVITRAPIAMPDPIVAELPEPVEAPEPLPVADPRPAPEPRPVPEPRPTPEPRPAAEPTPVPAPTPEPRPVPDPRPEAKPCPAKPAPERKVEPVVDVTELASLLTESDR